MDTILGFSRIDGEIANQMMGILVKSLRGGPEMLVTVLPCCKPDAQMLSNQLRQVMVPLLKTGFTVRAILFDNHKINQGLQNDMGDFVPAKRAKKRPKKGIS